MPRKPRRADLRKLGTPGEVPGTEDRAAFRLARAIHASESTDVATSWSAQERAQDFFNAHGLARTLDECERLERHNFETRPTCEMCGEPGPDVRLRLDLRRKVCSTCALRSRKAFRSTRATRANTSTLTTTSNPLTRRTTMRTKGNEPRDSAAQDELKREYDRLVEQFAAQGGRGVELADQNRRTGPRTAGTRLRRRGGIQ